MIYNGALAIDRFVGASNQDGPMKRKFSRCLLAVALACSLAPAVAAADPKTADEWYKEGEDQYNLGNFDVAIKAFQEGFRLEPNDSRKSAYLYNIAQSYRQMKDCAKAQFFYKRFLAFKDKDTTKPLSQKTRDDVEARIRELEDCARNSEAIAKKPPDDSMTPDEASKPQVDPAKPTGTDVATKPDPDPVADPDIVKGTNATVPRVVVVRLVGGGAAVTAGDLEIPVQATGALLAGYPIRINPKLTIEAGAGFTFTPVPYVRMDTGESKSAALVAVIANAGIAYQLVDKLNARLDIGGGLLLFSGISESPFTMGAKTSGALTMPHVRVGLSIDYAITPNLLLTAAPIAFSYSPPKEGLRDDITSITAIDFMIGLGYRM